MSNFLDVLTIIIMRRPSRIHTGSSTVSGGTALRLYRVAFHFLSYSTL